ncbi:mucoidy inhibitor MuiA family protein, partial [Streptomyces sp. NRRL WC-3742]|uniref:mucoidy inhibitor MuiA family protein n=1 Tax=Streptomyces sp. NRRL WC-3742 TaxID=1463934 RepID=UPI00131BC948
MDDQRSIGAPPPVPAHTSALDSVVVYAEGALCRRRATVPVPPDGRLRLTGLPASLDGRSLRARVLDGPPGAAVTEARVEHLAELREPAELPDLQRELDEITEHRSSLSDRHHLVLAAIDETTALRALPPQPRRGDPLRRTPAEAWLELAEFVDERLAGLQRRAEELTRAIELADHELAEATDRLERESTAEHVTATDTDTTVLVTLSGTSTATDLTLELEYAVPAARWVPTYRLSYRTGADSAELVLRACVAQQSGEDWTGVRLALSTADLDRRTDLPRLNSLRIGRSQPAPPPSGWREPPAGLSDLFTDYDAQGRTPRRRGPAPEGPLAHPLDKASRRARGVGARPTARGGALAADEPIAVGYGGAAPQAAFHAETEAPDLLRAMPPAPGAPMPSPPAAPAAFAPAT